MYSYGVNIIIYLVLNDNNVTKENTLCGQQLTSDRVRIN